MASLDHPHICALYDLGRHENVDFLVLEYLEGETLADRLAKGGLPLDLALRYAIEMADALDQAHRQDVVHRDLKPANVMITKCGERTLPGWKSRSFGDAIAAILERDPPSLSSSQPLVPPLLDRVVQTCLAKDPDNRWQSARDILQELRWIAEGSFEPAAPSALVNPYKRRERLAWTAAPLLLIAIVILAVGSLWRPPERGTDSARRRSRAREDGRPRPGSVSGWGTTGVRGY